MYKHSYTKENKTVYYALVPSDAELPLPASQFILQPTAFVPPALIAASFFVSTALQDGASCFISSD